MTNIPFMSPTLTGKRFDGHTVPLELLKDLAVLEDMLVETAKWVYHNNNPGRQRLPRGFAKGVSLELQGIGEGSARFIVGLLISAEFLLPSNIQSYFEDAREAIVQAVSRAESGEPVRHVLPDKVLRYFDRLGRSLKDDEAIEFDRGQAASPARLTRATRRRLVLSVDGIEEVTEEATVNGMIPKADQDEKTCEIKLADGRKVQAPVSTENHEAIMDAFRNYRSGAKVRISGIGVFSRANRLQRFESIENVLPLDALDVPSRLEELSYLKRGWFEGFGLSPSQSGLEWLARKFEEQFPEELPLPYLYPTPDGDIRAEWTLGVNEASLEVYLKDHSADWHVLNTADDEEESSRFNLDDSGDWAQFLESLHYKVIGPT